MASLKLNIIFVVQIKKTFSMRGADFAPSGSFESATGDMTPSKL